MPSLVQTEDQELKRQWSGALRMALITSGLLLFLSVFRWTLMEFLTPFLEPLLEMTAGLVFLASLVWSIVHLVRRLKPKAKEASAPLLINLTAGLIVIFVPFTALTTNLD